MPIKLDTLTAKHQNDVIDIFNYYVENSFAAYPECKVPYEYFERFLEMSEGYPAIVAVNDNEQVLGFGMLRSFRQLASFSQVAEITYFIEPESTGLGIGKKMLDYLLEEGRKIGLTSVLANISSLNTGSINFHKKNGFVECGRFKNICRKHNTLFDIVYMQKIL